MKTIKPEDFIKFNDKDEILDFLKRVGAEKPTDCQIVMIICLFWAHNIFIFLQSYPQSFKNIIS